MKETVTELLRACVPPLLDWYTQNRRELPWRMEPTPYHVWISEIMLQQTRIEAAVPYYERFLHELPDAAALSVVPEERLLKLWEGLGYYSRARNLKKAAEQVMVCYGGTLPHEASELRKLPGIGAYTAGAIASIAYGEPEPAVDGNVLRVIMRLTARGDDVLSPKTRDRVAEELRQVYPSGRSAGLLTEGLMELGETVCIPNGEARCLLCPLREQCRAFAEGSVDRYPVRSQKKSRRVEERTVLLLRCGERWAIHRRAENGFLAGMWEFPGLDGRVDKERAEAYLQSLGIKVYEIRECGESRHIFTHVEWQMTGYFAECEQEGGEYVWKSAEEIRNTCAIPTAFKSYIKLVCK